METNEQVDLSISPEVGQQVPLPDNSNNRRGHKKQILLGVGAVVLILAVAAAFYFWPRNQEVSLTPSPQDQSTTIDTITDPATQIELGNLVFNYKEDKTALAQVSNFEGIKKKYDLKLTAAQEKFLNDNRLLLVDLDQTKFTHGFNFDDMLSDFDSIGGSGNILDRKPEDTKFITPDIVLHSYHKYFEMTLEQLEQAGLSQALEDFLVSLQSNLSAAVKSNNASIKVRYQNLEAQIAVAHVLFENKSAPMPDFFKTPEEEAAYNEQDNSIDSFENAKKILEKYSADLTSDLIAQIQHDLKEIYDASNSDGSSLFSQYSDTVHNDYTQFTPRSHYTKNSALRAYFRTMMYLGRSSYFLQKDVGITDANLLSAQFKVKAPNGIVPFDPWKKIMDISGFYAGQSDDLTYNEWQDFVAQVLGSGPMSVQDLSSTANIQKMAQNLNKLRNPKILSDVIVDDNIWSQTKADLLRKSLGFRIFGQRFTFDAWVLNDLTAGQEKTDPKLPSTPSGLFVPAALGDAQALDHTKEFLQKDSGFSVNEVNAFLKKMEEKKADISKVKTDEWYGSFGSGWLYVLASLTHKYDQKYPLYMRVAAFLDKQIQTFLGSYAELKHDTLLYAKQSYAERGGGGGEDNRPTPPVVRGFVEPNVDFWNRFNQLLDRTEQVFVKNNLFENNSVLSRLQEFKKTSSFFAEIVKKELQGEKISDDDYEKLRTTRLSFMADPFDNVTADEDSGKVALIADIHTDAVKNKILYEATGKPYLMLAVVGNENAPRAVAGLVYNHYELTAPLGGQRLTDEDWRKQVYDDPTQLPAKNFWYQSLIAK